MNIESMTVGELEEMCQIYAGIKTRIKGFEEKIEELKAELYSLDAKLTAYFEHYGKTSYKSQFGDFGLRTRTSFKIPRTVEAKRALFNWLEGKGIFWETVGVNSRTLNALANNEIEACSQDGTDFQIPGLDSPEMITQVVFKAK